MVWLPSVLFLPDRIVAFSFAYLLGRLDVASFRKVVRSRFFGRLITSHFSVVSSVSFSR